MKTNVIKFISVILCILISFSTVTVFAEEVTTNPSEEFNSEVTTEYEETTDEDKCVSMD